MTTDTKQAAVPAAQTNGIDELPEEDERTKLRPVDIDADVKEMERRKRVEAIMNSKLFREELERIIETQLKDGVGAGSLMQQISDMMGLSRQASAATFKNANCVLPINDIRGVEAMGYAKGEKILRCKLAAVFRLMDLYGWSQGIDSQITARLNQDQEHFLVNPNGLLYHEITASSLVKVDMQGNVVEQGTTNFGISLTGFSLHAAIHAARPDIKCIISVHTPSVAAVSSLKCGLLPITQESVVIGEVSSHPYTGGFHDPEEKEKVARNLGPLNKVLLLTNQGAVCCGETIEEAFFNVKNTVLACETQLKLIPVGVENLTLLSDEARKKIYDAARKPPQNSPRPDHPSVLEEKVERKFRIGGAEFEALMRMLDNAGFRTGYIYRHPLVKNEPPKPKNDVELPPAVSSLGYLLEEEELYKQGLWKRLEGRRGNDRTRWLNSPNVYQKVEILETGTPDPKKITKWVAEGSPTHSSTPVKIDSALQFVPKNTNPKEFKKLQQQIKDYRRADKLSAGPQSHILEGVTWEEAKKMQDATVTQTGDHVVLMGAASKGIIQRDFQHNAMVYKSPYAKNPFDSVTDEELDEYKKTIERKARGEYDTDFSESEGLSSSKRIDGNIQSPLSAASETEEESKDEPQVLRIETSQAPKPSQPEVVLSDVDTPVQQRKNERVSVSSNRSRRAVKVLPQAITITRPSYYRTNSHSGFPKGSYMIPNPTHFHVTSSSRTSNSMIPVLKSHYSSIGRPSRTLFDMPLRNSARCRPLVTINIGDARSLTMNISMQTLREFIYPFANALNVARTVQTRDVSSQTSFLKEGAPQAELGNVEYTPLNFTVESDWKNHSMMDSDSEAGSDYEKNIIENLRTRLITDVERKDVAIGQNIEESDQFFVVTKKNITDQIADLAEQLTTKVMEISGDYRLFESVVNDALDLLCQLPFKDVSNDEIIENGTNNIKDGNSFKDMPFKSVSNEEIVKNGTNNIKDENPFKHLPFNTISSENIIEVLTQEDFDAKTIKSSDVLKDNISSSALTWYHIHQDISTNQAELAKYKAEHSNIVNDYPESSETRLVEPTKTADEIVPKKVEVLEEFDMLKIEVVRFDVAVETFPVVENDVVPDSNLDDAVQDVSHKKVVVPDNNLDDVVQDVNQGNVVSDNDLEQNCLNPSEMSYDEGISACSICSRETSEGSLWHDPETDEKVIKMSEAIYDYLLRQCFEIKELVIFPEILYDSCVSKLFDKLQKLYAIYCGDNFTNEQKNELRLRISAYVIRKLELNEKMEMATDSSDSYHVSDKVFSISEFVSDILDNFFEKYIPESWSNTLVSPEDTKDENDTKTTAFNDFSLENMTAYHSTPQREQYVKERIDENAQDFKVEENERNVTITEIVNRRTEQDAQDFKMEENESNDIIKEIVNRRTEEDARDYKVEENETNDITTKTVKGRADEDVGDLKVEENERILRRGDVIKGIVDEVIASVTESKRNKNLVKEESKSSIERKKEKEEKKELKENKNLERSFEMVTAFKTRQSQKSGSEKYWISISPTSDKTFQMGETKEKVAPKIINVDDIPLRPPLDLLQKRHSCSQLSPIEEEPRRVLFAADEPEESDDDLESSTITKNKLSSARDSLLLPKNYSMRSVSLQDNSVSSTPTQYRSTPQQFSARRISDHFPSRICLQETKENHLSDSAEEGIYDFMAGGDSDQLPSYLAFVSPIPSGKAVFNSAVFFRSDNADSTAYMQSVDVAFTQNFSANGASVYAGPNADDVSDSYVSLSGFQEESKSTNEGSNEESRRNDEVEDDEGNWMGFESAKF